MATYEFTVIVGLRDREKDPTDFTDALFEAGCDDAIVGVGNRGSIALEFHRNASSAKEAVDGALAAIRTAIPDCELIEIKPDLVNLAESAELLRCSRQNIRKYAAGEIKGAGDSFPRPAYVGSPSLWHFCEIAEWFSSNATLELSMATIEVAHVTYVENIEIRRRRAMKAKVEIDLAVTSRSLAKEVKSYARLSSPATNSVRQQRRFRALRVGRRLDDYERAFDPMLAATE